MIAGGGGGACFSKQGNVMAIKQARNLPPALCIFFCPLSMRFPRTELGLMRNWKTNTSKAPVLADHLVTCASTAAAPTKHLRRSQAEVKPKSEVASLVQMHQVGVLREDEVFTMLTLDQPLWDFTWHG